MKKVIALMAALLLVVPTAFAADFSPTVTKLSAPTAIHYEFDASELEIPISLNGTGANVIFMVYTKDQASSIPTVTNGFLGWHTVNKIDTCIFWDNAGMMDMGNSIVTWDGNDNDGNAVATGEYTYYFFGYDSVSLKKPASPFMIASWHNIIINDHDPVTGAPLDQPWMDGDDTQDRSGGTGETRGRWKWTLGNDPEDLTLVETTIYDMPWKETKTVVWSPYEKDNFYTLASNTEGTANIVRQYNWVPNGQSTHVTDWGEEGSFSYATDKGAFQVFAYVGDDILVCGNATHSQYECEMVLVDAAGGEEMSRIDLSDWWVDLTDEEAGGQASGWPSQHDVQDGNLIMGAWTTCMHQVIKPSAGEEVEDWNVWANSNGDYIGDHNSEEDANNAWVCNDYNVAPYMYSINLESNMFSTFPCYDMGAVTFGLMGPDGTGIDYFALAGETAGAKLCTEMVNYGSAYDGMYTDNESQGAGEDGRAFLYYSGYDSIKGVITSAVAVDDALAGFSVPQNSPNPFNPSTTISFSIPEAGNVKIDVFNVAGQKVNTIASEFMSAGSQSVTWDASGFSAGVYFYTVKSGDFTKTMKMTLLK